MDPENFINDVFLHFLLIVLFFSVLQITTELLGEDLLHLPL